MRYVYKLLGDHLAADGGDEVREQHAVQVRQFVLDHACPELVEHFLLLGQVFVEVPDLYPYRPAHVAIHSGHAQAALLVLALLGTLFQYHRVDEGALESLEVGIDVGHLVPVYDNNTLAHTYLRRCQAATLGTLERVLEVRDKLCEFFFLAKVGFGRALAEHLGAVKINRLNHFFLSRYACRMIAALILSTLALSRRRLFFMPPSIMALWARTEVKRSSSRATGTAGKAF